MTPNIPRLLELIAKIEKHPETWNQNEWHAACGTAHCLAGHAQIAAGRYTDRRRVSGYAHQVKEDAMEWLGLTKKQAEWLFDYSATIQDFKDFAIFPHDGYGPDGFDRLGRDREGFNRDGYDWEGFNRDGYSWQGYDRDGYDRNGLNYYGKRKGE